MSLEALTAIWRSPPCSGGDLLCLLAIADNADESGYAWPSMGTIARKAAMSERGARKCIKSLTDAGLIEVEIGGGRGKSNGYQITTNGMGETAKHNKAEQYSGNNVPSIDAVNPEQRGINPEQSRHKPGTPVPPNPIEPSEEQVGSSSARDGELLSFREIVLEAMGHDKSGVTATGQVVCNPTQMLEVNRWKDDLGLSEQEIISVIEATVCRSGPPSTPKYYSQAMQRFAGEKAAPKLQPTEGGSYDNRSHNRLPHRSDHRPDAALEQIARLAGIGRA